MSKDIRVSPKYGVNPGILSCPLCGQSTGVALFGLLKGDVEAPRNSADASPCTSCTDLMSKGFLLIEIKGKATTGRQWVIATETAARVFGEADVEMGAGYITPKAAAKLGLTAVE